LELTTNELVDILRTYSACENEGVGAGNDEFETEQKLLQKIREELQKRGATETCGYCNQPLYVEKAHPEYKGKKFCFGRCKDLWKTHKEK
jgi:hypothetical protein